LFGHSLANVSKRFSHVLNQQPRCVLYCTPACSRRGGGSEGAFRDFFVKNLPRFQEWQAKNDQCFLSIVTCKNLKKEKSLTCTNVGYETVNKIIFVSQQFPLSVCLVAKVNLIGSSLFGFDKYLQHWFKLAKFKVKIFFFAWFYQVFFCLCLFWTCSKENIRLNKLFFRVISQIFTILSI
jgi:hypothetical protein